MHGVANGLHRLAGAGKSTPAISKCWAIEQDLMPPRPGGAVSKCLPAACQNGTETEESLRHATVALYFDRHSRCLQLPPIVFTFISQRIAFRSENKGGREIAQVRGKQG
jgi:hypothetical protein